MNHNFAELTDRSIQLSPDLVITEDVIEHVASSFKNSPKIASGSDIRYANNLSAIMNSNSQLTGRNSKVGSGSMSFMNS